MLTGKLDCVHCCSNSVGETILDDALPDVLYFITLLMVLLIGRYLCQISIVTIGHPRLPPVRLTIQSMLAFTLIVSLLFFAMVHKVESNRGELVKLDSPHGAVSFLDVLGIVTPLSSAVVTGVALILLAYASTKKLSLKITIVALAICFLHIPPVLERQAFHWIDFGPKDYPILPNRYDILGAISTVLVCASCLACLRWAGLRIECRCPIRQDAHRADARVA